MGVEQFSIKTADGVTSLHGELAFADEESDPPATLVIVPGGWFMDRDGFTGDSGTPADLMYRRIGERVANEGFIVVRYDNRGVTGNELTTGHFCRAEEDCWEKTEKYLRACIDFDARRTVTPETGLADLAQIYDFVLRCPRVNRSKVVLFAHSEGGLHVARLIGRKRIVPGGVVFLGVITESPAAIVKWQAIDGQIDQVMRWDQDRDGVLSSSDIAAGYADTPLFADIGKALEENVPDTGWSRQDLAAFFERRYEAMKAAALETDDARPYPTPTDERAFVAASYRWWKQWFTDITPTIDLLCDYTGMVSFHFGGLDSQAPAERQTAFAASRPTMPQHARTVVHPARGHSLRSGEPLKGPMDADAENLIVEDLTAMLRAVSRTR